jgi:DNA-binding transcriptional regulator YiaG
MSILTDNDYWSMPMPNLLKVWRSQNGLSQSQAAFALSISFRNLQNFEQGRNAPKDSRALVQAMRGYTKIL